MKRILHKAMAINQERTGWKASRMVWEELQLERLGSKR